MSLLSREACKQRTLDVQTEKSKNILRIMTNLINESSEKGYFSAETSFENGSIKYMLEELTKKGYTCKINGSPYNDDYVEKAGSKIVRISWD